jgi:hypothetical protein
MAGRATDETDKAFDEALGQILARGRPPVVPDARWSMFAADASYFLATWGPQAARLDWTAEDLFELHPVVGLNRQDTTGLCWMLKGERVVALTATEARLSGGLAHYRSRRAHSPPLGILSSAGDGRT